MKRYLLLFSFGLFMNLCSNTLAQVPYHIEGTWKDGAGKQVSLHLCKEGELDALPVDSVRVAADGSFSMQGSVSRMGCGIVYAQGAGKANRMVFFDGSIVTVEVKDTVEIRAQRERPATVIKVVKGNKEQAGAQDMYQYYVASFTNEFSEAFAKARLEKEKDAHKIDSLKVVINQIQSSTDSLLADYKTRYAECYVAPYFMELNMLRPCTTEQINDFYNHLSASVKASPKGKWIGAHLASMNTLNPGCPAPDFVLQTAEGQELSLKELRGKIVLIDFWASWCAPCLGEMPNVKKLYAKYHEKGLEVLGISMDNKKEAWLKSIEKEQLPWLQVSSLKGMGRCPVAKSYEVMAIPKFYIIDREGRIVAKDLRGKDLAEKVSSLFE